MIDPSGCGGPNEENFLDSQNRRKFRSVYNGKGRARLVPAHGGEQGEGASIKKHESIAEGVLILDTALRITSLNEIGRMLLGGNDPNDVYGKTLWEASGNGVDPELKEAIELAQAVGECSRMTARSERTGRWYEVGIYPTPERFVILSFRNVTDRLRSERTTLAQKRALEMAMAGEDEDAILLFLVETVEYLAGTDAKASLLFVEDGHLRRGCAPSLPEPYSSAIDGVPVGEGIGSCGTAAYRGEPVMVEDIATDPLWENFRDLALSHGLASCWSVPISDSAGNVLATFAIYHDRPWHPTDDDLLLVDFVSHTASIVMETRRRLEEKRAAEERLELALRAGSIGTFRWDMAAGFIQWDERLPSLLGLDPDTRGRTLEDCLELVHPDDLDVVKEHIETAIQTQSAFDLDFRVVWRDGSTHWLAIKANTAQDAVSGNPVMAGAVVEITTQKQLYADLRETAERLSVTLDAADLGDWVWDLDSDVVTFSERAAQIFGIPPGPHMTWSTMRQMLDPEDLPGTTEAIAHAVQAREIYDVEYRVNRPDGVQVWVSAMGRAQYDDQGNPIGMYGVVADISARKAMEVQLRERAAALAEADQRKDEFLATLAHELRNPLAPLRSGLDLLKIKRDDGQTLGTVHAMMDRQITHMVRLVDDLLDVSRITRGALVLRKEDIDLNSTVSAAVETAEPVITAKGHRFSLDLPDETIRFQADPTRLAQVLANLLNNAAKYTPAEGQIELSARRDGPNLVIEICDNGIGFGPEQKRRLFEMFTQVHTDKVVAGGLGIGLTLARRLVELHGGSLHADSPGPGLGSCFTVRLPLPELCPLPDPTESQEVRATLGKRILVADDNVDAADLLRVMLTSMGHDVLTVNDGGEALVQGRAFRPEVMILDIGMPIMDGREAARRAREEDWGREALLVALTGWGQPNDRHLTSEAGFDHHLVKPVDMATLEKLLSNDSITRI